jgi:hypothetical protein
MANPLIWMDVGKDGLTAVPDIAGSALDHGYRPLPFSEWWQEPVLKMAAGPTFSRMTLVQNVADTDGGAHVDPDLEEAYQSLSRENGLRYFFRKSEPDSDKMQDGKPAGGKPELACIRQIAHELLYTLHRSVPELKEHAAPVIPDSAVR